MRASTQTPHELRILLRYRMVRRLSSHRRIVLGCCVGILVLPGLHICFPLFLLTLWLLQPYTLLTGAALARRDIVVLSLHPMLVASESYDSLRWFPTCGKLLGLSCYYVFGVQEACLL